MLDKDMQSATENTIWRELESWAATLQNWQKFVLATAVRDGALNETQIDDAYKLLLKEHGLTDDDVSGITIPNTMTGRPVSVPVAPLSLVKIDTLTNVNALPTQAELTFGPNLTVVYGGNGAGKSGFARILGNACFSRVQNAILPNVYAEGKRAGYSAIITIKEGQEAERKLNIDASTEHDPLKRFSVFDTGTARAHLTMASPFEYQPTGFDVFPEMARIYGMMANKLTLEINARNKVNSFPTSFIEQSKISDLIGQLNATTDLAELKGLSVFGETEKARFEEVDRQLIDLRSKSPAEMIASMLEAKADILALVGKIKGLNASLTSAHKAAYVSAIADYVSKSSAASAMGSDQFKKSFFKAVGTQEWEGFVQAAHALAHVESADYAKEGDHCLLCHRPLDGPSIKLINSLWGFLVSDARQKAEAASAVLEEAKSALSQMDMKVFSDDSRVYGHLKRRAPVLVDKIVSSLSSLVGIRDGLVSALNGADISIDNTEPVDLTPEIDAMVEAIDADIVRLRDQKIEKAIASLTIERVLLRHREVLSQIIGQIETYVRDLKWASKASGNAKAATNPRSITEKERVLSERLIGELYEQRLHAECLGLRCALPIQLKTKGDKGKTIRSLSIAGSYKPEQILSEGEQRAIAIADFLTEVSRNPASAGIILDDPVTSQDHERKALIAQRLVTESKVRQVVIFTHDLVFLTMLDVAASTEKVDSLYHWVQRDSDGKPGLVSLDDSPTNTPQYQSTDKAKKTLAIAKRVTGSVQESAVRDGLAQLRRTVEEIIPRYLLKEVVTRWRDRIIVTALHKINWDETLISEIVSAYEDLSALIEGHTHTEERAGEVPGPKILEEMIVRVDALIKRAKSDKQKK